jgi:hypothetical protein
VGQWRFDEGLGTVAHDTSGSGLDGTLTAGAHGATPSWVAGVSGSALRFDHHDAVALPSSAVGESPQVTVAAWVRRAGSPGAYRYVFSKGATGCYMSSYALYTGRRGSMAFYVSSGGHYTLSAEPSPSAVWDGRWHRVVGTYDGRDVRLYVDGRQVGAGIPEAGGIDYGLASRGAYIGAYRGGCVLPFSGDIDTVELYASALTDAEIAADAGLAPGDVPPPLPGSGGGSLPLPAPAASSAGSGIVPAGCLWLQAQPRSVRARLRLRIPRAVGRLTLSARAPKGLACTGTAVVTIPVHR